MNKKNLKKYFKKGICPACKSEFISKNGTGFCYSCTIQKQQTKKQKKLHKLDNK